VPLEVRFDCFKDVYKGAHHLGHLFLSLNCFHLEITLHHIMHLSPLTRVIASLQVLHPPGPHPFFLSHALLSRCSSPSSTVLRPSNSLSRSRFFSTAKQGESDGPNGNDKSTQNPGMVAAKFSELGATRTVKIVVIVVVSVLATMETLFWIRVGWQRFGWSTKGGDGGEEEI